MIAVPDRRNCQQYGLTCHLTVNYCLHDSFKLDIESVEKHFRGDLRANLGVIALGRLAMWVSAAYQDPVGPWQLFDREAAE